MMHRFFNNGSIYRFNASFLFFLFIDIMEADMYASQERRFKEGSWWDHKINCCLPVLQPWQKKGHKRGKITDLSQTIKISWNRYCPARPASHKLLAIMNKLRIYIWADVRNPFFGVCKQQRRRPACTSVQSDQHLCNSISGGQKVLYSINLF